MPSPFKRSRQIQPMSQAELDASMANLEAKEAEDKGELGFYIQHDPADDTWWSVPTERTVSERYKERYPLMEVKRIREGSKGWRKRDDAESLAKLLAADLDVPYLGER